jgi:hypothetical protein
MRANLATTILLVAAGCGGGGSGDDGDDTGPDGRPDATTTPTVDAAPCTKPTVFVNTLAGGPETYTMGSDDSRTNVSGMLDGPVVLGPMDIDLPAITAAAQAVFAPLGIEVTDVDPGPEPHLEIVIAGDGWPFDQGFAAYVPGYCTLVPNAIAMVNGFPGRMPEDLAISVGYAVGVLNGLEFVEDFNNCMSVSIASACTFSSTAAVSRRRHDPGPGRDPDREPRVSVTRQRRAITISSSEPRAVT